MHSLQSAVTQVTFVWCSEASVKLLLELRTQREHAYDCFVLVNNQGKLEVVKVEDVLT